MIAVHISTLHSNSISKRTNLHLSMKGNTKQIFVLMIKLIHFQPESFCCYDENPDHWPMQRTTGLLEEVPQRSKI